MKRCLIALILGCSVGLTGCPSKTPVAEPQFVPPPISPEIAQEAAAKSGTPEVAVETFLEALKHGKSPLVAALLSETARTENARHGMQFSPEQVPNSSYKVVQAVYPPEDPGVAHVSSMWSDGGEEMEIIWVLRQETAGWRVAGAAMPLDISQEPIFINFEEPSEIQQIQQAREAAAQAAQSAAPPAPGTAPSGGANTTEGNAAPAQTPALEAANQPAAKTSSEETTPIRTANPTLTPLRK